MDFSRSVLPHTEQLRKQANKLTRNQADAEDLLQDTLLRAFRHWATFADQNGSAKAWLYRIMFNCFVNQRNIVKRRDHVETAAIAEMSTAECQLAIMIDNTLPDEVVRALNDLSTEFRTLIEAVDIGGTSYAEMAKKQDLPLGTVMSRIFRGRGALRKSLRDYAETVGAL